MALNDVFELAVRQQMFGITCFNVFHFQDIRGDGDAQHLADYFATSGAFNNWRALGGANVYWESISTTQIVPYILALGSAPVNVASPPYNPGLLSPVVTAVVTWTTGYRGKRNRGRSYLSSVMTGTSGANISSDALTRLKGVAAGLFTAFGQDGSDPIYRMGVWSRVNGMNPDGTSSVAGFKVITGYVPRTYTCSMGTRRSGHGI